MEGMHKIALDRLVSRKAAQAQEVLDANPIEGTPKEQDSAIEIQKYLVTFITKKAKGTAIVYDKQSLAGYTPESLKVLTYGGGGNFQWDTLLCYFLEGAKRGLYVVGLTSDGRMGSEANVFGDTSYSGHASKFLDALKAQHIPFPFMDGGASLRYKELGMNDARFVDVSSHSGERDDGHADRFEGAKALAFFKSEVPGSLSMTEFTSKFGGDGYRYVDLRNGHLHHVDGTEDAEATVVIKKIMSAPAADKASPAAPAADAPTFAPLGVGKSAADGVDTKKVNDGTKKVNDGTKAVKELTDAVKELNSAIGGKAAATLDEKAAALLMKYVG